MNSFLEKHPHQFGKVIDAALINQEPQGWRAAWLLVHGMKKNDERVKGKINAMIKGLTGKKDGHQRELLKVLEKMELNEDQEGRLFDACITIWESVGKSPSVRIFAYKFITQMAKKYPELNNEIEYLSQSHYTETLSPGIKKSFDKMKVHENI